MIVTIVDPSGVQIYRGHDGNDKVARLVSAGNARVDTPPPDEHATWDGAVWVPGTPPVPPPAPLTAEELYDMLLTKGVVGAGDRPRARP